MWGELGGWAGGGTGDTSGCDVLSGSISPRVIIIRLGMELVLLPTAGPTHKHSVATFVFGTCKLSVGRYSVATAELIGVDSEKGPFHFSAKAPLRVLIAYRSHLNRDVDRAASTEGLSQGASRYLGT